MLIEAVLLTIITASTPLLLAAAGELVVERSGVLNLGIEGMMIIGAACGFAGAFLTGSTLIGALAGILAGTALAAVFAALTLGLAANQVASGLALTIFGGGCAGLAGAYLPLAYTPFWVSGMTAGRGWIALALVVFASWLPWRLMVG